MNRDALKRSIQAHEGLRLKPYADTVGKVSIGYGRNLTDCGISQDEADALLEHDIDRAVTQLVATFPWAQTLDDVRFGVLAEMTYNLGITNLRAFTQTLGAVERGQYEEAARLMLCSRWASQVGQRAKRLATRMKTGTQ